MGPIGRTGAARGTVLAALLLIALALAGCANTSLLPGHHASAGVCAGSADGPAASRAELRVVCGWSAALRRGDLTAAAGYFGLPSVFYNETGVIEMRNRTQVEIVNSTLSCGAKVLSAYQDGRSVNVLFRLVARRGRGGGADACGAGIGQTARTRFIIRAGRIIAWLRAPTAASGGGSGTGGSGSFT